MTCENNTRKMPNGELTDNVYEYLDSWQEICSAVEKKGLTVIGFDPGITVQDKDHPHITCGMPLTIVKKFLDNGH